MADAASRDDLLTGLASDYPIEQLLAGWETLIEQGVYPAIGGYNSYEHYHLVVDDDDPLAGAGSQVGRALGLVRIDPSVEALPADDPRTPLLREMLQIGLPPPGVSLPVVVFSLAEQVAVALTHAGRDSALMRDVSQRSSAARRFNYELSLWFLSYRPEVIPAIREVYGADQRVVGRLARGHVPPEPTVSQGLLEPLLAPPPPPTDTAVAEAISDLGARIDGLAGRLDGLSLASPAGSDETLVQLRNELAQLRKSVQRSTEGPPATAGYGGDGLEEAVERAVARQVGGLSMKLDDVLAQVTQPRTAPPRAEPEADGRAVVERLKPLLDGLRRLPMPDYDPELANHSDELKRMPYIARWLERFKSWLERVEPAAAGLVSNNAIAMLYATSFEAWLARSTVEATDQETIHIWDTERGTERRELPWPDIQTRHIATQLRRRRRGESIDRDLKRQLDGWAQLLIARNLSLDRLIEDIDDVLTLRRFPAHEAREVSAQHVAELRAIIDRWLSVRPPA